jgi:hypothetical protein
LGNRVAIGDQRPGLGIKKPPDPGKAANEGIQQIPMKTDHQAGLILLIDGEVIPNESESDEHRQTGILTWASDLLPAFPVRERTSGLGNQ